MTRQWETIREYKEIKYELYDGIAKVTINRPEVRNAFTPNTVQEMIDAFTRARDDQRISVIVLTGEGDKAFCSGGDQKVRGHGGYVVIKFVLNLFIFFNCFPLSSHFAPP